MDDGVLDQPNSRGADLLSRYGVAGLLDGVLEILGAYSTLIVGDLDGALLDVGVCSLHPGEFVQLALDGRLAVAAVHVRNPQRLLGHHHSFLFWMTLATLSGTARRRRLVLLSSRRRPRHAQRPAARSARRGP